MTLLISQDDAVVSNSDALSDAPAVRIIGARVRFTNSGTLLSTADSFAAVILEGADTYLFNAASGIIRSQRYPFSFGDAILGSNGTDTIVNEGRIDGDVDLGGGADSFTQRSASQLNRALMGAGNDLFTIETPSSAAMFASGGADWDRVVIGSAIHSIVNGTDGFEQLELLSSSMNLTSFGGFQTILLAAGGFYNFLNSSNPLVDLTLDGGSIVVADRSRFRGVTGSTAIDMVDLNDLAFPNGGVVTGDVSLGGGNDRLTISWTNTGTAPAVQGNMDGGAGTDSLNLTVTGGRAYDLTRATGFETLNLGSGTVGDIRVQNANGFATISIAGSKAVLEQANNPNAILSLGGKANVSIDSTSAVNLVTAANGSTTLAGYAFIQAADETKSVILANAGAIGGNVILFLGSDQLDARAGTVVGTVYGLAGDDTILMGAGNNNVDGGYGADHVEGGAGNDGLTGGGGDDWLDGGADNDSLTGGDGNDRLFGGDGDDSLSGGVGADIVAISGGGATIAVDGGADGDTITLGAFAGAATLTLGTGQDMIAFSNYVPGGALVVTDFQAGNGGDRLEWSDLLAGWLTGWNGTSSLFAGGYLSIVQDVADVLVRLDRDGAGGPAGAATFITLKNVSATALTAFNLDGHAVPITGTGGDDILIGTEGADTFNPLLGRDQVDGLGGDDTLIVDYSSAPIDPYAGASPADVPSVIASNGGSFSGAVKTVDGGNYVMFTNIEHLQVKLDFWHNRFILDGSALASGATINLDGGAGTDTLDVNLSALASVDLQVGPGGTTASFGMIVNFENFALNLTAGADHVTTGAGKDMLTGNGGDDLLNSGEGNDILSGGSGSNSLNAGGGDDQITSAGLDAVDGGAGYDIWSGDYGSSSANFSFTRNLAAGSATLSNGTTLAGIERIAALTTGSGNDVFTFAQSEGTTVTAGAGEDVLNLTGSGFSGDIDADGSAAFAGFLGNDRFSGIEHLNFVSVGFADSISVDAAPLLGGATLSLDAGGGVDSLALDLTAFGAIGFAVAANGAVTTNVPITLANFETYRIDSGAGADTIATQSGNDEIHANGGNDVIGTAGGNDLLDGGSGADAMTGGLGDDIYFVDDAGDSVTELAGEGFDEVRASLASYTLADSVEKLSGLSAAGQTLTGNGLDNLIFGGSGNDVLIGGLGTDSMFGGLGNDTYHVDAAGDYVDELDGAGSDRVVTSVSYALVSFAEVETLEAAAGSAPIDLTGNRFNQLLIGNDGANVLDGGAGIDVLNGLGGDDLLYVDDAGDVVIEAEGGGSDRVVASVSYALGDSSVEVLEAAAGSAAINLTGNGLANAIRGNDGANLLNGGGGADDLSGGRGNDTYIVDNGSDLVHELSGEGSDLVYTSVSYALAAGEAIEALSTQAHGGTAAINLIGNEFAQTIYGNFGANVIDGRGGADVMAGFAGDDLYIVDNAGDQVLEGIGQGNDSIVTNVSYVLSSNQEIETLSTQTHAGTDDLFLTGNQYNNTLIGNAGDNILNGVGGADVMIGLDGDDTYAIDDLGDLVIDLENQGNDL
ncbi:MAG TPA: calcium-binding protein, partial [Allosphingosinicella sp.]|nr:calcium-binding protein [Allosphingosinicella sp.]